MKLYKLRAFPKEPHGGNKAGVVLEGNTLTDKEMLGIAYQVGYSETAFVLPSDKADFRVRFFTPEVEVDLCGHATIATFNLLRDEGIITPGMYTQDTKAGILKLDVQKDLVFMEQNPPVFFSKLTNEDIKNCFRETDFVDESNPIMIVSTGMKEIFLPVKSTEVLHQLTPNLEEIKRVSKEFDVIGIHAFSLADEVDAYGRNFAPLVGIDEESATGTSNGALGCYLHQYVDQSKTSFVFRQGFSMNQPSEIYTNLIVKDNLIKQVFVGGSAIRMEE